MLHFLQSTGVCDRVFPAAAHTGFGFFIPQHKTHHERCFTVQAVADLPSSSVAEVRVVGRGAAGLRSGEPSVPQGPDDQGLLV